MSKLRQRMIEDMKLKGLADRTQKSYIRTVEQLAKFHKKSPALLNDEDLRAFFVHLHEERQLSANSLNVYRSGIMFLYHHTLQKEMPVFGRIQPAIPKKLPVVFTRDEVRKFLSFVNNAKQRTVLTLIYACGLRISEGLSVEAGDIDGDRGFLTVRNGKGLKDRNTILPKRMYEILQGYWLTFRPQGNYLFPSRNVVTHLCASALGKTFRQALQASGIPKRATVHSLRHSFATHLLDRGVNIRIVQRYLGHNSLQTTQRYAHVTADSEVIFRTVVDEVMSDL